jgi:hypothetical protein
VFTPPVATGPTKAQKYKGGTVEVLAIPNLERDTRTTRPD